jgi:hypothetical protein
LLKNESCGDDPAMDERTPSDRLPIIESLVYVASSFLTAWFCAGFSLGELIEILAYIGFAGRFVIGVPAGACLIWWIVRCVNHRDDTRLSKRP